MLQEQQEASEKAAHHIYAAEQKIGESNTVKYKASSQRDFRRWTQMWDRSQVLWIRRAIGILTLQQESESVRYVRDWKTRRHSRSLVIDISA